jgi:hypothetical protein
MLTEVAIISLPLLPLTDVHLPATAILQERNHFAPFSL